MEVLIDEIHMIEIWESIYLHACHVVSSYTGSQQFKRALCQDAGLQALPSLEPSASCSFY